MPRRGLTVARVEEIKRLITEGQSNKFIARALNCRRSKVAELRAQIDRPSEELIFLRNALRYIIRSFTVGQRRTYMENLSRTVRFKSNEVELIDLFLSKNQFFDFSSLTRTALMEFIRRPSLQIQGIESSGQDNNHPTAAPMER